jgi:hypothetical protein
LDWHRQEDIATEQVDGLFGGDGETAPGRARSGAHPAVGIKQLGRQLVSEAVQVRSPRRGSGQNSFEQLGSVAWVHVGIRVQVNQGSGFPGFEPGGAFGWAGEGGEACLFAHLLVGAPANARQVEMKPEPQQQQGGAPVDTSGAGHAGSRSDPLAEHRVQGSVQHEPGNCLDSWVCAGQHDVVPGDGEVAVHGQGLGQPDGQGVF